MSYEKQNFVSGQVLSASQMNHIEQGIEAAQKIEIGTVTSGMVPGATVTNGKLNLVMPKGERGDSGETGATPALRIGTVERGSEAAASITGTAEKPVLNLVLPKGDTGNTGETGPRGPKGDTGALPAFAIGTVTRGSNASASITGTAEKPILNLVLPKGDKGDKGDKGSGGGPDVDATLSRTGDAADAKVTGDGIAQALDAMSAEYDRAIAEEDRLDKAVQAEATRAQQAEAANARTISAETTRAQQAEKANTDYIDAEVQRAQQAEKANTDYIDAEVQRAQQAEATLRQQIANTSLLPYRIVYDHSYNGTGSQGTYGSPVRIPLAGDYDAVVVIRTEMSAYPADSESPKRRVLLELVTQESGDGTFQQNYITLAGLPTSFTAANTVNTGLIVIGGLWGRSNVRLRYANRVLDLYYEPSFTGDAPLPKYVWNESGWQYHVFGITWNGGTLHG